LSLQSPIALAVFTQQPHSPPFYGAWDYIGPAWAFVEAVAVDPHDQRIVYAGLGANKGVFRSDDAGVSWTPRCVGLGNLSVSAIAISHFDGTIFAGTDDGLFFSKDRCETWSRKNDRYCGMEVTRVVLSPHEPGFLLVGTREGGGASVSCGVGVGIDNSGLLKGSPSARSGHLHITRDSGASWLTYPFDTVNDACIASDDSRLVYVAGAHGGVLRTVDGFETCERLKNFPGKGPVCISLDPDDSRVVLVGTLREGLYQSFDAGATWNKIHCIGNVQVAQVFFAARHSKQVFAATRRGMFDSVDGGREWRPAIDGLTHEWCMSVASSKEGMVYCGTSGGGVYRRGVGQRNWISSVQGFPASPAIVLASGGRKTLFAGTPVGLFRSRDVGSTWQLIACAGEAVTAIVLRNTKAEHLPLGLSFGGLHISRDGGESIQESPAQGDAILEVHVGTYLGNVYRSGDSGRSWKKLTPPFGTDGASSGRQVRSLAVASSLPDQLYAVVEGAGIRRSTDGGINWGPFGAETCGESVISLCLSRHHERMIYAATQDRGLCASDDGGSTWFRVKDLEGQTIIEVVEPLGNGQLVYAVSLSRFVFKSRDGIHWEVLRSEREADSTSLQGKWATLAVSADGSKLALGSSAGAFLSLDGGSEWTPVSGGVLGMDYYVNHLLFADDKSGNLYAAMKHGICSSKVGGLRTTSVSASASMA
jgi:photosystem II stability/assembly factor-like uncharacterized protein